MVPPLRTGGMRERDIARLAGVEPRLVRIVIRLLDAMEVLGFPMLVTEGLRSDQTQFERYAQGRTQPGKIVSNADGVAVKSMHQAQSDGFGHAVDLAFMDDPETALVETYDLGQPWDVLGEMAEAYSLTWGGRWKTLVDRPHVEMSMQWRGRHP